MKMGVLFDNIHSFHDLNLVLSDVEISPANPKTNYVDIPGGDGLLDLTEAHGEVKYDNRTVKLTFTVHPSDELTFDAKIRQVSNALNGRRFDKITLDRDPDYYWQGRCVVDEHKQDRNLKQISVSATVKPYKLKQDVTVLTRALTPDEITIILENSRKTVVPTIECTEDGAVIVFGDITQTLAAGTCKILDVCLIEGSNFLRASGSGTITFTYQEGDL